MHAWFDQARKQLDRMGKDEDETPELPLCPEDVEEGEEGEEGEDEHEVGLQVPYQCARSTISAVLAQRPSGLQRRSVASTRWPPSSQKNRRAHT